MELRVEIRSVIASKLEEMGYDPYCRNDPDFYISMDRIDLDFKYDHMKIKIYPSITAATPIHQTQLDYSDPQLVDEILKYVKQSE